MSENRQSEAGPARAAALCLRLSIAFLCLGTAVHALRYEGPVFSWLFMHRGWTEAEAVRVEHGASWLLLAVIPLLFPRSGWPALLFVSAWMAARAAAQAADEVWHPELVPLDLAARVLAPLALAALAAERLRLAEVLLRAGVAASFLGHGIEALLGKPEFIDLLLASGRRLAGLSIEEAAARNALAAIGAVDLLVAAGLLLPCRPRPLSAWAAAWGLLTAASRSVQMGADGLPDTMVRLVHAGAPLALLALWSPRPLLRSLPMPSAAVAFLLLALPAAAQDKKPAFTLPTGTTPAHGRVVWTERPESRAQISWSTSLAGSSHRVHYDVRPRRGEPAAYAWKAEAQKNCRFTGSPVLHYHHATLTGLSASTTYYFVMASDAAVSPEFHFVTAPEDDRPFRLLVGGDSRSDAAARRKMNGLLAEAVAGDPSILALCHGGDYVRTGTKLEEWIEWMGDHELTAAATGRMLPVIPARGNHERSGPQYDEVWNGPGGGLGKNYFATRIGAQALLVTLNTNVSAEGDQARFLEKTLSEHAKLRWQVAQYHRPLYPAVKSPSAGKDAWVPIFERRHLDLACESDGHNIKRTLPIRGDKHDPTGVTYIVEGGLGVSQRTPDDDLWYLQAPGMSGKGHHYFLLGFEREALRIRAVLMDGSVIDEHLLRPRRR